MTLQETYASKLIQAGGKIAAKQSSKYLIIEFPYIGAKSGNHLVEKVYLGKAGAVRIGDTVTASRSVKPAFIDRLAALAVPV